MSLQINYNKLAILALNMISNRKKVHLFQIVKEDKRREVTAQLIQKIHENPNNNLRQNIRKGK